MHEDIELMRQAGVLLFGEFWLRSIARALGPFYPDGTRDQVDHRLARRWVAGQRDIPGWALIGRANLLDHERMVLETSCLTMRRLAVEIRHLGTLRWHLIVALPKSRKVDCLRCLNRHSFVMAAAKDLAQFSISIPRISRSFEGLHSHSKDYSD